jgi:hypothetical protein
MSDWQACWADWNCCELGSTPLMGGIEMPLPFETGSGKFAIPCERMHWECFSRALIAFWNSAGETPILPFGSSFWQAL